jgi:hypothetical protein
MYNYVNLNYLKNIPISWNSLVSFLAWKYMVILLDNNKVEFQQY